jgi:hypothetical protein
MENAVNSRPNERRQTPRWSHADEHGIVTVRVRSGHRAALVDVSAGGALVETTSRLLPGARIDLLVEGETRRTTCPGRVLRCAVVRLRPTVVCYQAAIAFDQALRWFLGDASIGYAIPITELHTDREVRVDPTRGQA